MNKLFSFVFVVCLFVFTGANAYDRAHIENRSLVGGKITIKYSGPCEHDSFKISPGRLEKGEIIPSHAYAPHSRGECLITSIRLSYWENHAPSKISQVNDYRSAGTTYGRFIIVPRTPNRYRIMSSHELGRETKDAKMSPGFRIHNRTHLPLSISLDQIGCLYYQNKLLPGQVFDRNTGGVWFTINAKIYDPNSPKTTDFTCALPIATTTIGALAAVAVGPAYAAQYAANFIAQQGAMEGGKQLMAKLNKNSQVRLMGQYAGSPWPLRCKHKPEYEIVGGPSIGIKEQQKACLTVKTGKYQTQLQNSNNNINNLKRQIAKLGYMRFTMGGNTTKYLQWDDNRHKFAERLYIAEGHSHMIKLRLEHAEKLCKAPEVNTAALKIKHINNCGG